MTDRTTTDLKSIPKAAPAPGHGCCGGNAIADPASKTATPADPSALGHAKPSKATETCCCGGAANK